VDAGQVEHGLCQQSVKLPGCAEPNGFLEVRYGLIPLPAGLCE
jgi:hypothetical protein